VTTTAHIAKLRKDQMLEHAEEEATLAMKAAIAHVIGDTVQALGVCLAALLIWWQPFDVGVTDKGVSKWNYADPLCTCSFGVLVLLTTKATLKQTINSLMVRAPPNLDQELLTKRLLRCPGVTSIHDLHVWTFGSNDILCTAHLMIKDKVEAMRTLNGAIDAAKSMGIGHSTFQIEFEGEFDPSTESYGFHENPLAPMAPTPTAHSAHAGSCGGHGHGSDGSGHGHDAGHDSHDGGGHSHAAGHSGDCCAGHSNDAGHAGHDKDGEHGHGGGHGHSGGHGGHGGGDGGHGGHGGHGGDHGH